MVVLLLDPVLSVDAEPPTYQIDLDKPANIRWREAFKPHISTIKALHKELLASLSPRQIQFLSLLLKATFLDPEIKEEIKSAAEQTGLGMETFVVLSFFYELRAYCTSMLVKQKDGSILHGRNLDYPVPKAMRELVANVEFVRDGKLLYRATTFIGYFGVLTGVKPGAFAISLDQRSANGSFWWNLMNAGIGKTGNTFAIRKAFEKFSTYEEVVAYLSEVPLITDSYYIISGTNSTQGAVITRYDHGSMTDIRSFGEGSWYLVQTNYDPWAHDPTVDNRRTKAEAHLKSMGMGQVMELQVWEILSAPPVFNVRTIYTTLMNARTGALTSKIRGLRPREELV